MLAAARTRLAPLVAMLLVAILAGAPCVASASVSQADMIARTTLAESPHLMAAAPDIDAPAGILETIDGRELWSREADAERAMASTTKIMTAIVVLEQAPDLEQVVVVSAEAAKIGEAGIDLEPGENLTVRQLLSAMLVHSANDAAYALAQHVAGGIDEFVQRMNDKAAELDLDHTRFTNPHGLDEPGHHTSAADLATLAEYAMRIPLFRELVGLRSTRIPAPGGGTRLIEASNKLIGTFDGATGVKTGWTSDAGYCLVASAERGGVELVAVILGAQTERQRFDEAADLLEWGFAHYAVREVSEAGMPVARVPVSDYLDVTVAAMVAETTTTPVFDLAGEVTWRADVVGEIAAPVAEGERLGTLTVRQGDRLLAQVPVVAAADVAVPGFWERIGIWFTRAWRGVFGGQQQAEPVYVM
ncbi:MAG: D-alanyl-D-alanine carboxypeptidase family protein [Anaerosomatales bacterium]|nr:D-alanyl-D-alanine carboxypeptidase family protein [Anaerosomatales bacterium]